MKRDRTARVDHDKDNDRYLWYRVRASTRIDRITMPLRRRRLGPLVDGADTWCLFVGYPRSGHSLVSSMLDAHPDAMIGHRLDAVRLLLAGHSEDEVTALMIRNSERFARTGRTLTGYSFPVPGQWQGRSRNLRVVGDQEANWTSRRLGGGPGPAIDLAPRLRRRLRMIHVVRNPFDNIVTWARRRGVSLEVAIDWYFDLCRGVARVKDVVAPGTVLDVFHEDVVTDTIPQLRRIVRFLELEEEAGHIEACADLVVERPHASRLGLDWSEDLRSLVEARMAGYPWLAGYAFDDALRAR